jgi:CRP/FNR family cyclic AMP-dependent transcriptional regulator
MRQLKNLRKSKSASLQPHVENMIDGIARGRGKILMELGKNSLVFSQGDRADSIYFVETGKVKVSVLSPHGKEAILGMVGPMDFFGEGCLVGQLFRTSSATTTEPSTVTRIRKQAMIQALHSQPELSENFTTALLARNIALEEDLCDQIFNHSEKRLARILLKLSRLGQQSKPGNSEMPRLTHETLAEMVGTTRSRISFFMNKFRKLGLIDYKATGEVTVRSELMTDVVLHD